MFRGCFKHGSDRHKPHFKGDSEIIVTAFPDSATIIQISVTLFLVKVTVWPVGMTKCTQKAELLGN